MSKKNDHNSNKDHSNEVRNHCLSDGKQNDALNGSGDNGMRVCLFVLVLISSVVMTVMTH